MKLRASHLLTLLALLVAGVSLAGGAAAITSKVVPKCKAGQKSTKAHPCTKPVVKEKTPAPKPKVTPKPGGGTTTTTPQITPSPGAGAGVGVGGGVDADGCPVGGPGMPQNAGGDGDEDNNGGPSDGDGCI